MNTRLQVEHPVTEMVTSIDLVQWQIRIARGERLDIDPERALTPHGHAIECRIYAEDPDLGFMPSPGLIRGLRPASGPGIRDDGGVGVGYTVPVFYDSMIAKLVAWGGSRPEAIARMRRALREYQVLGIKTTIPFFLWLMRQPDYQRRRVRHDLPRPAAADAHARASASSTAADEDLAAMAAGARRLPARQRGSRRQHGSGGSRQLLEAGGAARGAARMTFEIDINGRTRTVAIEKASHGSYRVALDGEPHELDAARVGVYGLSLLIDGEAGTSREVQVTPGAAARRAADHARRTHVAATVNGRRTGRAAADSGAGAHGEQAVAAPDARPRRPRPRRRRRRSRRPPAGRRRRSYEDGKRAAVAEGRPREGSERHAGHLGRSRPRSARHRMTDGPENDAERRRSRHADGARTRRGHLNRSPSRGAAGVSAGGSSTSLALITAIFAGLIVTLLHGRSRALRQGGSREARHRVPGPPDDHRPDLGEADARASSCSTTS